MAAFQHCAKQAVETGTAVGGTMFFTSSILVGIGSLIGAPFTGGASLVGGATTVGAIAGAAATGLRSLVGKPCESPAVAPIKVANEGLDEVKKGVVKLNKLVESISK